MSSRAMRGAVVGRRAVDRAIDHVDSSILSALTTDARLSMRELAKRVHMSAPAVGERVRRLEEDGVILGYALRVNRAVYGKSITAFINVTMRSAVHGRFLDFAKTSGDVREVHRLSGDSCYLLRVEVADQRTLEELLERILEHGNYRLNISLSSMDGGALR